MNFIDTHTHLYAEEFDQDIDNVIHNSVEKGVTGFLLPAIDRSYYERMMLLAEKSRYCYPMTGLHPTSVKKDFHEELDFVKRSLEKDPGRFCGIGEIGIDLYWDKTFMDQQIKAFEYQLDLAIEYSLPIAIHTRNSFDLVIELIRKKSNKGLRGVFHCFGGSTEQAKQATGIGFMLGIGGIITYKNSGLQKVVEETALDHLLLETDAPYLPPVPYRGQRNESTYIPIIANKIAEIKGVGMETVAEVTTKNALSLFKISSKG